MFSRLLLTPLFLAALSPAQAQQNVPFPGAIEIEQSLHKLNQLGTVLMVAAHPDDERTSVLAYFARGRHMRTAYLSLTRGEGGQNLIGSEQGLQLGIIRTQELLAARKIDGAEQFFTRAIDFGFSKTASETLEKWGHDRILSDIVWVVRRYRPDVIILVFTGTTWDGHGQHQVSAILAKEAFEVSGDPKRFPEQLQYVQPWHARRLLHASFPAAFLRALSIPEPPRLPESGVTDTGAFNPILGYSYEELATMSRSMHHSQGTGAMRPLQPMEPTAYGLVAGEPASKDPFDGIDTTWNRLPGGAAVGAILDEAIRSFEPAHPEKTVPPLAKARPLVAAIDDPLARVKLAELDETMAQCAGLFVEAQARQAGVTPGAQLSVTTTIFNRSKAQVTLESGAVEGIWNESLNIKPAAIAYDQATTVPFEHTVPVNQPYSRPYWLVKPPAGDVYDVGDQRLIGLADTPPVLQIRLHLTVEGAPIELVRPVHYRYAASSEGERVRPLVIVPAVAVNLPDSVAVFPAAESRKVYVDVQANAANAAGQLRLDMPAGWKTVPAAQPFQIAAAGEQQEVTFELTPPPGETTATMHAVATVNGRDIAATMQVISYPHFPVQTLFPPSDVKLVRSDIRVAAHKVGYIMGAGDEMPGALRQLGVEVTLLSRPDLEQGDLSRFDAIVAGVRAYNVRPDLRANQARLLNYVKNGGTYVVQYQSGEPTLNMGPYPITVPGGTRYRVTVEEAPVAFPHPDCPLLQYPNRITPKDFEGWVQERGLNFATKWDGQYETVLSSHDPGEDPMEGGELWTRYGKGVFIFTAYAWFRQLPAGVPGAYRLFANILSAK